MADDTRQLPENPDDEQAGEGDFPVSRSARSLLRRLEDKPVHTPRAGGTGPFMADPTDTVDLDGLETQVGEPPQHPAVALGQIEASMAEITQELTGGQINHAQFQALYSHYAEQKALILRLLDRDPGTDAWQRAAFGGHTGILRKRHAARLEGLALLGNRTGTALRVLGHLDVPGEIIAPLLDSLRRPLLASGARSQPLSTQIEGGRWLAYTRGQFVSAITVYSAEPSGVQLAALVSAHEAFESLNRAALAAASPDPEKLTYPQEALFEED